MRNNENLSVALVEDNNVYRGMMALYLQRLGCKCVEFAYPELLIDSLREQNTPPPDVIVMDIYFDKHPKGYDATETIAKEWPDQCIVMLTGSVGPPILDDAVKGISLGATDFVAKPNPRIPAEQFIHEFLARLRMAYDRKQKEIEQERKRVEAEIAKIQNNIVLARGLMHQSLPRLSTAVYKIDKIRHSAGKFGENSNSILENANEARENLVYIESMMEMFNNYPFEQITGTEKIQLLSLLSSALETSLKQRDYLRGDTQKFLTNLEDRGISPTVIGSSKWLFEAFMVVFNNAFEAMAGNDSGKLVITLRYEQTEDKRMVRVDIADDGCGISEEIRKHIFEPFFTTKSGHGMGIGLSFAKSVFEAHNGFINVDSEEGKGTTFSVYLPERVEGGTTK